MNVDELEAFIDEGIRRSEAKRYYPHEFKRMRKRWGTTEAIRRLVISGEMQSGFRRMKDLDLLEWSLEEAVRKFPRSEFNREVREAAEWRLEQARAPQEHSHAST